MRRANREIAELDQILDIVRRCEVCRIALHDAPAPYVVPLSFGFEHEDGKLRLYFHCAAEGKKIDLIEKNPMAGFSMDAGMRLVSGPVACAFTAEYESVVGAGRITRLESKADKCHALARIMAQYVPGQDFLPDLVGPGMEEVCALRLDCDWFTAKANKQAE